MIEYIGIDRDTVIGQLGDAWPVPAGATTLTAPPDATVTDGALIVRIDDVTPGALWWLVDSIVPPQAAGPITPELAALVPGSVLVAPPPDDLPDSPPLSNPDQ